jgi:hypothetical protein
MAIGRLVSARSTGTSNRDAGIADRLADGPLRDEDDIAAQLRARQVDAIRRLEAPLMLVNMINVGALLLELALGQAARSASSSARSGAAPGATSSTRARKPLRIA